MKRAESAQKIRQRRRRALANLRFGDYPDGLRDRRFEYREARSRHGDGRRDRQIGGLCNRCRCKD
jgi:hypothetical protein